MPPGACLTPVCMSSAVVHDGLLCDNSFAARPLDTAETPFKFHCRWHQNLDIPTRPMVQRNQDIKIPIEKAFVASGVRLLTVDRCTGSTAARNYGLPMLETNSHKSPAGLPHYSLLGSICYFLVAGAELPFSSLIDAKHNGLLESSDTSLSLCRISQLGAQPQ
jgi:hypothetical protein